MAKILVALSGGVDSAVSALLLKQAGHDVSTAYIRTWLNEETPFADCPAEQDIKDSIKVAKKIKVDHNIVNLVNEYREKVVQYLINGYKNGLTPNPDIMCNKEMKFGVFQDYAFKNNFDLIATGHYVRKVKNKDGSYDLFEGKDKNKDQSYFLSLLTQSQIKKSSFPLGDLTKNEVRNIALKNQLPNANKKDSQGICFLGDMNINRFLDYYIDDKPGPIINEFNEILGEHKGLHHFTIGQRKGIGIPSNTDKKAYVVTGLNFKNNSLHIALDHEDSPLLYSSRVKISDLNFTNKSIDEAISLSAKPRYRDPSQSIKYLPLAGNQAEIYFDKPQRALALGQVLALYYDEKIIGGGFYSTIVLNEK